MVAETITIDLKINNTSYDGDMWCVDFTKCKAFLVSGLDSEFIDIRRTADIKIIGDDIYFRYHRSKKRTFYEKGGPESQRKYKEWLVDKLLEEEVFNEN